MIYCPDQLMNVVPFVTEAPTVVVIAGPADANEAQTAKAIWPRCRVVGAEPNAELWKRQMDSGWPGEEGTLFAGAFSERVGKATLHNSPQNPRGSSLECTRGGSAVTVPTTTIDEFLTQHFGGGIYSELVLIWADVEGHELSVIRGAHGMLCRGVVGYVNVECIARKFRDSRKVHRILNHHGLELTHIWNCQNNDVADRFYRRHDLKGMKP